MIKAKLCGTAVVHFPWEEKIPSGGADPKQWHVNEFSPLLSSGGPLGTTSVCRMGQYSEVH